MKLVYIHGASATSASFNYIREHIADHCVPINYSSQNGFENNLKEMQQVVSKIKGPVFFIAHSLGGVYALHLTQTIFKRVAGAVTLSTPYGGSREAEIAKIFLPSNQLMKDIGPTSPAMRQLVNFPVPRNWTNIVTTQGASPFISKRNDGVVTWDSMTALSDRMDLIELDLNHYEVVLSPKTVNIIKSKIELANSK